MPLRTTLTAILALSLAALTFAPLSAAATNGKGKAARSASLGGVGITGAIAVKKKPQKAAKASSGELFRASKISEFWLQQSAPGAITEVADPAGSGQSVLQMTVANADVAPVTPTENPRAELLSDPIFKSGMEFWASAKFFLPADFPTEVPGWLTLLQGPYGAPFAGTPPWHIEVSGSGIRWQRNGTYDWDIPWEMPLVRGGWVNVLLHERFGQDGWVEMWVNGKQIDFFAGDTWNPHDEAATTRLPMQTQDSSNSQCPCSMYEMSYRKAGMFDSVSTLAGPLVIGTTRASVDG